MKIATFSVISIETSAARPPIGTVRKSTSGSTKMKLSSVVTARAASVLNSRRRSSSR
jgi:hypothetical protein